MTEREHPAKEGCWLAFDYGKARIGVAVATLPVAVASPLSTIAARPHPQCQKAIDRLVAEWQPVGFVVGWPSQPGAQTPHPLADAITAFAKALAHRHQRIVCLIDEALTSAHAERLLREAGQRRWQQRKEHLDAAAAALILQAFCDGQTPEAIVEP